MVGTTRPHGYLPDCIPTKSFARFGAREIGNHVGRAELVAMPEGPHPIPSRTRSLSPPGSMVLRLKAWESRSLPALRGPHET